jgi:hypothetical protein
VAEDAHDDPVRVRHHQAAHPALAHQRGRRLQVLVGSERRDVARHDVPDERALGVGPAVREEPDHQVAVRHHADRPAALQDGQEARARIAHRPGRRRHPLVGRDGPDVRRHRIDQSHPAHLRFAVIARW